MRCAKHPACWVNTKHSGRPPEDGRDRGTTSAGKTMRTRYKYQKCKNTRLIYVYNMLVVHFFKGNKIRKSDDKKRKNK